MRVPQFLQDQEIRFATLVHPPAYSSQRRAGLLHLPGKAVLKSVLLKTGRGYVLGVLPSTHHVQLPLLEGRFPGPVRFAGDGEVAEVFRDCEWGVRVPFGRLYGIPTILEDEVNRDSDIVFEAHFHAWTIKMACRDFEHLEKPQRLHFAGKKGTPDFRRFSQIEDGKKESW
jgi:Ala-tRNA(Pro) deacylase